MPTINYTIAIDETVLNAVAAACARVYNKPAQVQQVGEDGQPVVGEDGQPVMIDNPDSDIVFLRKQTALHWSNIVQADIARQAEAAKAEQLAAAQALMSDINISQL